MWSLTIVNNMAENIGSVKSHENATQENMSLQPTEDLALTAKEEIEKAMSQALFGVSQMESNTQESAKPQNELKTKVESSTAVPTEEQEEEILYIEPIQDPYGKAIKYLEQHNILQLFQALTTNIVYRKPADPLSYMMKEIQKMKSAQEKQKT